MLLYIFIHFHPQKSDCVKYPLAPILTKLGPRSSTAPGTFAAGWNVAKAMARRFLPMHSCEKGGRMGPDLMEAEDSDLEIAHFIRCPDVRGKRKQRNVLKT